MEKELMEAREYEAWLSKFEAKKTTDDCYTPAAIYAAVKAWAVEEYKLEGRRVFRPFYPGGDYEGADYQDGDVVIDNPPFSIMAKIVRFYESNCIDFFLFAPSLTLFSHNAKCSIVTACAVKYANGPGAGVNTSFMTSLDDAKVRTAPKLKKAIEEVQEKKKEEKPKRAKYVYPDSVITAALLEKISKVDFRVYPGQISNLLRELDSQKEVQKKLFGKGFLISEKKAAELAELKASVGAIEWPLSEREMELIRSLNND